MLLRNNRDNRATQLFVAAQRDRRGTVARRSRSRDPGLGRVGPSGSEATGWHHYDGAQEITWERSRGRRQTAGSRCVQESASRGGLYLDTEETAGSRISYRLLEQVASEPTSPNRDQSVLWHCDPDVL
jgi:hypothetical protein